ncbi:hypothetical protein ACROYT_G033370 [Oculina patagonica]
MAGEKRVDCNIIVKNPVMLKVGDLATDFRSGVSVIDIIFPGNNTVEVGKLSFKNSYTASITVKLKVLDPTGTERWQTAVKNYTLMPHPHFETGSQDCFVIFTNQADEPPPQVIMLRLILRQPSPHWSHFGIDEIKCFLHSTMNCPLVPRWLQYNDCHKSVGIKSPQNCPNSEGVASNIQQLWAMTQEIKSSKQGVAIGRFDIDRSYDINLLSYT